MASWPEGADVLGCRGARVRGCEGAGVRGCGGAKVIWCELAATSESPLLPFSPAPFLPFSSAPLLPFRDHGPHGEKFICPKAAAHSAHPKGGVCVARDKRAQHIKILLIVPGFSRGRMGRGHGPHEGAFSFSRFMRPLVGSNAPSCPPHYRMVRSNRTHHNCCRQS